jgi:hypothetical protein
MGPKLNLRSTILLDISASDERKKQMGEETSKMVEQMVKEAKDACQQHPAMQKAAGDMPMAANPFFENAAPTIVKTVLGYLNRAFAPALEKVVTADKNEVQKWVPQEALTELDKLVHLLESEG